MFSSDPFRRNKPPKVKFSTEFYDYFCKILSELHPFHPKYAPDVKMLFNGLVEVTVWADKRPEPEVLDYFFQSALIPGIASFSAQPGIPDEVGSAVVATFSLLVQNLRTREVRTRLFLSPEVSRIILTAAFSGNEETKAFTTSFLKTLAAELDLQLISLLHDGKEYSLIASCINLFTFRDKNIMIAAKSIVLNALSTVKRSYNPQDTKSPAGQLAAKLYTWLTTCVVVPLASYICLSLAHTACSLSYACSDGLAQVGPAGPAAQNEVRARSEEVMDMISLLADLCVFGVHCQCEKSPDPEAVSDEYALLVYNRVCELVIFPVVLRSLSTQFELAGNTPCTERGLAQFSTRVPPRSGVSGNAPAGAGQATGSESARFGMDFWPLKKLSFDSAFLLHPGEAHFPVADMYVSHNVALFILCRLLERNAENRLGILLFNLLLADAPQEFELGRYPTARLGLNNFFLHCQTLSRNIIALPQSTIALVAASPSELDMGAVHWYSQYTAVSEKRKGNACARVLRQFVRRYAERVASGSQVADCTDVGIITLLSLANKGLTADLEGASLLGKAVVYPSRFVRDVLPAYAACYFSGALVSPKSRLSLLLLTDLLKSPKVKFVHPHLEDVRRRTDALAKAHAMYNDQSAQAFLSMFQPTLAEMLNRDHKGLQGVPVKALAGAERHSPLPFLVYKYNPVPIATIQLRLRDILTMGETVPELDF